MILNILFSNLRYRVYYRSCHKAIGVGQIMDIRLQILDHFHDIVPVSVELRNIAY